MAQHKDRNRVAIYARYSSNLQREESIDAQLRACRDYAKRNNLIIVGEYIDRGKSATTANRPEFQRMIEDSNTKAFDIVLVHKLDRFARNRNDSILYRVHLKRNDIVLKSVIENLDPDAPESIILESVIEGFNEYYSRNLAREVEKGKKENAYKCLHTGGIPPLGYDVDKTTLKLSMNESEAKIIRTVFSMFLNGCGYSEILTKLNINGYKTKRGESFSKTSINGILKNEKYTGVYIYNKSASKSLDGKRNGHKYKDPSEIIRKEGGLPQIVSKEDFDKVQEILSQRRKNGAKNTAKETYLLSGKIKCGVCGSSYTGNSRQATATRKKYVDYRCNKKCSKVKCTNKGINRDAIEQYVLDRLSDIVFNPKIIPQVVKRYKEYLSERNKGLKSEKTRLEQRLTELNKEIDIIAELLIKNSSDILFDKLSEREELKEKVLYELDKIELILSSKGITEKALRAEFNRAKDLFRKGSLSTTKKLVDLYVNQVIVYPDKIRIEYNLGFEPDLFDPKEKPQKTPDQSSCSVVSSDKNNAHNFLCALNGGEGETRTPAPVTRPTPLAGAPRHQLEYFSIGNYIKKYN